MLQITKELFGEAAMLSYGEFLAAKLSKVGIIYLHGNLGMGKTTLVKGFLQGCGYSGPVKSPTYTLVEPYELKGYSLYHFDLYRLSDPEELEYIGIRDYFTKDSTALIEWPEKGLGYLPDADVDIRIELLDGGRCVTLCALNGTGESVLRTLE